MCLVEFERHVVRGCGAFGHEGPCVAPVAPYALLVLCAHSPEVTAVGIEQAGAREGVPGLAGVRRTRGQLCKAHGQGPSHIGLVGELEMVVGDRVAIGIDGGGPLEGEIGTIGLPSVRREDWSLGWRRRTRRRAPPPTGV